MGTAQLREEYSLHKPMENITGSYSFLKCGQGLHPTTRKPITLYVFKKPHKLINPNYESEFIRFDETKQNEHYTVAISNEQFMPIQMIPFEMSVLQLRLLLKCMIEKPAEMGRFYFCNGKYKLWCEDKRGFECQAPEQVKGGKTNENSNVFCSAVSFINFLCMKLEKSKTGFFQPKTKQQYLTSVETLNVTVETSDFWHILEQPMKQLLKEMLNPKENRISPKQINNHFYMNEPMILVYYDLCQLYAFKEPKQLQYLRLLHNSMHLFETDILKRYIIPILVDYLKIKDIAHECVLCIVEALNRCKMIETNFFQNDILQKIITMLKNSPTTKTVYNLLLKAEHWCNYMSMSQFQLYFGSMLVKAYESNQPPMIALAIYKTQFFVDFLQEKEKLQLKLINSISHYENAQLKILGMKCIFSMIRKGKLQTNLALFDTLEKCIGKDSIVNIHVMKIMSLLVEKATVQQLFSVYMKSISRFLMKPQSRMEFDFAYALYEWMLACVKEIQYKSFEGKEESYSPIRTSDYADDSLFVMPKELPQEFQTRDEEEEILEFAYFRYAQNNENIRLRTGSSQMQAVVSEDEDFQISQDFGKVNTVASTKQ